MNNMVISEERTGHFGQCCREESQLTNPIEAGHSYTTIYGDWVSAIPDACSCLLNLDHDASNALCSHEEVRILDDLKRQFVEVLYMHGL